MSETDLPRCRSCFAVLRFVRMGTGKAMPCNPVPDKTGNVAARKTRTGYVDGFVLRSGGAVVPEGYTLFRTHFADCDMRPRTTKPRSADLFTEGDPQ